jgi:glutathione S-transferase
MGHQQEVHVKLYFRPGACSLSPHIVLREAGLPFELDKVDTKAGKTAGGEDFRAINPKGYVPTLRLDDGQVLTEGAVIVQFLADQKPQAKLAPPPGSMERYRLAEWLNYIATELHKGFSPLFNRKATDEARAALKDALSPKLAFLARHLEARQFVLGDGFTVADAYLFTILNWSLPAGVDLGPWPPLQRFHERIAARPAVREALKAEGLIKS